MQFRGEIRETPPRVVKNDQAKILRKLRSRQRKKTMIVVAEQQDLARFNNDSHLCCVPTQCQSKLLLEYKEACSEVARQK